MTGLRDYPPRERWHDWTEFDAKAWPDRVEKRYTLIPTTCFNCEAGCGLVAYVNQQTGQIDRFEGNPDHPASRGRNCAKGPATVNQVHDPERILHPLKRAGERGRGPLGASHLGSSPRRHISPAAPSPRRGPPRRDHVPRRAARRRGLHRPGTQGLGGWTATTATPTSARPAPASATRPGWATTARRPTTPTPRSSS